MNIQVIKSLTAQLEAYSNQQARLTQMIDNAKGFYSPDGVKAAKTLLRAVNVQIDGAKQLLTKEIAK